MADGHVYYYYNEKSGKYCRRTQANQTQSATADKFNWKGLGMLIPRHQRKIELLQIGYDGERLRISGLGVIRRSNIQRRFVLIALYNERFIKNYEYTPESEG